MKEHSKIMEEFHFDASLVLLDIDAATDEEAIDAVAAVMVREGLVKTSYPEAVKAREKEYATGLELLDMGIAIPHTVPEYVHKAAMALGILKNPVSFACMGEPDKRIPVEIIIMLSIVEPHAQLTVLQKLLTVFQAEGKLSRLKGCRTPKEAADMFTGYLYE